MLADVGGLNAMLVTFFSLLTINWNYNSFDNFMVQRLFKITRPRTEIDDDTEYFERSEYIKVGKLPNCTDWLLSFVPKRFACQRSRNEIAMKMAREKLDKEINIIEIVKSWRYFESALRFLLPEKKRLDFKERSRYIAIDPTPDE